MDQWDLSAKYMPALFSICRRVQDVVRVVAENKLISLVDSIYFGT